MTIEEKTFALLSAASGVTSLCPVTRIKPPGNWQNLGKPYIVHQPIAIDPARTHTGVIPLKQWVYQVSCFTDARIEVNPNSYKQARDLALAVVAALDGTRGQATYYWRGQEYQYENDVLIHHVAITFEVFEAL